MELKQGYKQTEVGVIPEDWAVIEIGDLNPYVTSGSRGWARFYSDMGAAFIRITNLTRESIALDLSDLKLVMLPPNDAEGIRTEVKNGDLLVSITADIGVIGFVDRSIPKPAYINQHIALVRLSQERVDPKFASYYLASRNSQRLIRGATDQGAKAGMNLLGVRKIRLVTPPVCEQRAIAVALSDVDTLLAKLDALIAKKRDLKQAAMQQLLTGRQRLPGFGRNEPRHIQTELGQLPADWNPVPLERISAFITKGATPTTYGFKWEEEGVVFLRSECVGEDGLDLAQSMFISSEAHKSLCRSEVRPGDTLITITGNVGRVVHLDEWFGVANINQHIARIRVINESAIARYVYHFLSQPAVRRYFGLITTGQAYPQISLKQVRDAKIPLPSVPEQTAIATVLSDMDAEIAALEARRDKTRALKQGMMQELLTGRIRLV